MTFFSGNYEFGRNKDWSEADYKTKRKDKVKMRHRRPILF